MAHASKAALALAMIRARARSGADSSDVQPNSLAPPPTTTAATAASQSFEPGSTFVILAAAARGRGAPTDRFYAENGAIKVANATITTKSSGGSRSRRCPELLQRGSIKVGPLGGAVLQVHLGSALHPRRGFRPGEPGTAPPEAVVRTRSRPVDRPGISVTAPRWSRRSRPSPMAGALLQPPSSATLDAGPEIRARSSRASFAGHQPGDGPDAHRDHDGGAQWHRPQCHPRLRRRGQDGYRAEARSRDASLLAGARRASFGLRARRGRG